METSPEFLQRLTDMDPEIVEGENDAFGPGDFEDDDDGGEDDTDLSDV